MRWLTTRVLPLLALALASVSHARVGHAEEKPSTPAPAPKTDVTAAGIRRDPKGFQGISPLWEAVAKGDGKFATHDYDGAISEYREALGKNPESALPHYRIAEAQKLKGELKEAQASYDAALRFSASDAALKAKILFCLADLSERNKNYDDALERWTAYETFAKTALKAKLHLGSAAERKKRIGEWKQLTKDSAEVKTRIDKRLTEADAAARKDATRK
jgi:tetratricopeptide (TPR) repeat protein